MKIGKLKGEFLWHHHDDEDELFMVIKGRLIIKLPGRDVNLEQGEFFIVPRGTEHMPVAEEETHVLLFEPVSTLKTGNVRNERTVDEREHLRPRTSEVLTRPRVFVMNTTSHPLDH